MDEHNIIMEDQYISLRYSRNLAEGAGLVFNLGERVEGFSNPLWVFLMAPAFLLKIDALFFNRMLCLLFGFAHFPLMVAIMRKHSSDRAPSVVGMFPAILIALSFPFLFWMKSGMETVFASFLLLSAGYLLITRKYLWSSVVFGLLALTRPEGIIYMATAPLFIFLNEDDDIAGKIFKSLLPGILIFSCYEVFRIVYFSAWLPNSFHAKVSVDSLHQKLRGTMYYGSWFFGIRGFVLLVALVLLARKMEWMKSSVVWLGAVVLNAFFVIAVGGDYLPYSRFIVAVMPAFALVLGIGILSIYKIDGAGGNNFVRQAFAIAVIVGAFFLHPDTPRHLKATRYALSMPSDLPVPAPTIRERWKDFLGEKREQPNLFVGQWMRDNIEENSDVAMDQCGIIPYISKLKTIDLFGLMSPLMVKTAPDEKPGLLMSMNPSYILLVFYIDPPFATYLPGLFATKGFVEDYCVRAFLVSDKYRRGNPGYVLFESAEESASCVPPPPANSENEVLAWLKKSINGDSSNVFTWDYSYDIFR